MRHVGDLSKPFFITVGCSHTKGVSLTYSNTWAYNIAKLFNMEHINLGFSGSSLEYQLSLITRAENVLPKAKFILWMHTYPSRSHKFFLSHILGDKLCRVQQENFLFYKNEIEMGLEYSDKAQCFELKLFKRPTRKVFVEFTRMLKISERSAKPRSLG